MNIAVHDTREQCTEDSQSERWVGRLGHAHADEKASSYRAWRARPDADEGEFNQERGAGAKIAGNLGEGDRVTGTHQQKGVAPPDGQEQEWIGLGTFA